MAATLNKYFVLKLNVRQIKDKAIDTYIDSIENKFNILSERVILIPIVDSQTTLTIVYQLYDNNGNITIKEVLV